MSGTTPIRARRAHDEAGSDPGEGIKREEVRRDEVLRQELERRLAFLEEADDSAFGDFTRLDWLVCTLLFFVLPLLLLGVMVL